MSSQADVEAELAALKGSAPQAIDAPETPAPGCRPTPELEAEPEQTAEKGPQS